MLSCSVDNSDYMRNGDFVPTRLQAQQDAVHVVCQSKTRSNPENNVGLLTLAKYVLIDDNNYESESKKWVSTLLVIV